MVVGRNSPRPKLWWTFGTVAIMFAVALMWLALNGGGSYSNGVVEGSVGLSVTTGSLHPQPSISHPWELGFLPPSLAPAQAKAADRPRDNLVALAVGVAGVLAVTGMALFLAWKLRPKSSYPAQGKRYHLLPISRRVSSF